MLLHAALHLSSLPLPSSLSSSPLLPAAAQYIPLAVGLTALVLVLAIIGAGLGGICCVVRSCLYTHVCVYCVWCVCVRVWCVCMYLCVLDPTLQYKCWHPEKKITPRTTASPWSEEKLSLCTDALSVPCKLMYSDIVNIMQYEYILVVSVFYIVHTTNSFLHYIMSYYIVLTYALMWPLPLLHTIQN